MSQQIIANPQALSAQYQLGNYRATYKVPTRHLISSFFGFICGCILTSATLALLIFLVLSLPNRNGFDIIFGIFFFPFFLFRGLVLIGTTLCEIITTYQNRVLRVLVYDYGFIYVGHQSQQAIYWQHVEAVRASSTI